MTPLNPDEFELRRVASAIRQAWEKCGEVPFPLYENEIEELAKAAIAAIYRPAADEIERLEGECKRLCEMIGEIDRQHVADKAELLGALEDLRPELERLEFCEASAHDENTPRLQMLRRTLAAITKAESK